LRAARRELDALSAPGYLSAEDVQRAARELVSADAFDREKILDFANQLGFWWSVGGIEYYLEYPRRVQQVRPDAAERFGRRYLPAGGAHTAVGLLLSPEARKGLDLTPEALERAFAPEGAAPAGPAVASADLPNGARVLSRRLRGAEVAAFCLYFRGHAERSRAESAGLEQLLLRTLADDLERREAEELARLGARVRFDVEGDYSMFGVQCLRGSLERAVDLLSGALRKAELRGQDVERQRAKMIDAYRKTMDNPDQAVGYLANRTFYPPGHPYLGYPGGTEESLKRLTLEELAARRALLLTGRRLLAAVAGDLGAEEAAALAARAVGDLPAGESPAVELADLGGPPSRITT
ncbi:MAG: insulinase family protein, partial [Thermoanaerobaculia bacterium]